MAERSDVIDPVILAASRRGSRLFRNNQGVGLMPDGSKVKFGVGEGGSDIIGWTTLEVTPDMVGKMIAVFTAVEAKTGRQEPTKKQRDFLVVVADHGGIALWGNDPAWINEQIVGWVQGLQGRK